MKKILVVGEDELTCALGERILAGVLPSWSHAAPTINTRGVTKLVGSLPRYAQFARNVAHVLCIADSDRGCPADLVRDWLPRGRPDRLLVRLAVTEGESWALGDRNGVATFFDVPLSLVPVAPDELPDPKLAMLRLVKRSRHRQLRTEMLSSSADDRPGVGYNLHMKRFVRSSWNAAAPEANSVSLRRAMNRVRELR